MQTEVSVKTIRRRRHSASLLLATAAIAIACAPPREQREILAADAETFQAIVRSQVSDSVGTAFLRVDSRPAGDKEILSSTPSTAGGLDPDSADSLPEVDARGVADQRKAILRDLHIEEGGPFDYPQCGGFRVNRFRDTAAAHPNPECPKSFHRYVTVGLPTRGATSAVTKARPSNAPIADTTGEQWTVLVTETAVGPGGQQFRQYAWLFRRDQQTGTLGVVEKYLLSWAE